MKCLQYNLRSESDKCKLKTPLIKVARIALRDRVDLISIMVPVEVVANIISIIILCAFG